MRIYRTTGARRAVRLVIATAVAVLAGVGVAAPPASAETQRVGVDVSYWNSTVDWNAHANAGKRFAYVRATVGMSVDPNFGQNYNGSAAAGLLHGAYHFARPDSSSGAAQANFFVDHGGFWARDGRTLPGVVDIENTAGVNDCFDKRGAPLVSWIRDFVDTYRARTGRDAVIYTRAEYWNRCTNNNASFGANPLWLACYCPSVGTMPAGWAAQTIWQYTSSPSDQDEFNGSIDALYAFARG